MELAYRTFLVPDFNALAAYAPSSSFCNRLTRDLLIENLEGLLPLTKRSFAWELGAVRSESARGVGDGSVWHINRRYTRRGRS